MGNDELQGYTQTFTVRAPAAAVLDAFFEHDRLASWWQAARSLCVPRTLGPYAVEWAPTDAQDDVLGRLGGVFSGTVMTFDPGREFFVADAYWLAPDGDAMGPLAFEVTCTTAAAGTIVHVRQTGKGNGVRWQRYYEVFGADMTAALERLARMLEPAGAKPDAHA